MVLVMVFVLLCDISVTDGMLQYRQQNKETKNSRKKSISEMKGDNAMNENKVNENELNINEMEHVSGGNFIDDIKDVLNKIIPKVKPDPVIAAEAKKDPVFKSMPELG